MGTEAVEGQGSHLPSLHRCLPLLAQRGSLPDICWAGSRTYGRTQLQCSFQSTKNTPCEKYWSCDMQTGLPPGIAAASGNGEKTFLHALPPHPLKRVFSVCASPRGRFNSARLCCNPQAACGGMAEWESASLPLGFGSAALSWMLCCATARVPCPGVPGGQLWGTCGCRGLPVPRSCPAVSCSQPASSAQGTCRKLVRAFKYVLIHIKYMFFWAVACVRAVHRKAEGVLGCLMRCCRLVPAQPGSCTRAFGSLCFWSPCSRHRHWFLLSLCTLFC